MAVMPRDYGTLRCRPSGRDLQLKFGLSGQVPTSGKLLALSREEVVIENNTMSFPALELFCKPEEKL